MIKLMKEYFADPARARIPWFTADVYRLTRNAVLGCDNMAPSDGTHYPFCPSVLMAKLILNGACDALESCPMGASPHLSAGIDCGGNQTIPDPRPNTLLDESLPDW